jgi:hypothetical protein
MFTAAQGSSRRRTTPLRRSILKFRLIVLASFVRVTPLAAQAATITADTVISYSEATRPDRFGPFGGAFDGEPNGIDTVGDPEYERIDLKVGVTGANTAVTDGNASTYASLVQDAEIVLGFSTGFIFDGAGFDLFVDEIGAADERADVFVSEDFGSTFLKLGTARGDRTNNFDFADVDLSAFGAEIKVNAVKIVGLDNRGSSPGFDLTFVKGLEGSVVEEPQIDVVPVPAGLPLILTSLGAIRLLRLRKS